MVWQTHEARHISIVKNKPNESHLYSSRALQGRGVWRGMSRINHIVRILSSGIEGVGNRAKYASQVKTLSRIN
jgi:hypothetical protein